jgi:hypothetical protein
MRYVVRLVGEVRLKQFWPEGVVDADTTKINVYVESSPFSIASEIDTQFQPLPMLDNAIVTGAQGRKAVITRLQIATFFGATVLVVICGLRTFKA